MRRFWKKHRAKIIYALILTLILSTQFQPTKAVYQALITVPELIKDSPVRLLLALTRKPRVKEVVIESAGRKIYADIYFPNDRKKHPAAVLDLGLDIDRKDPRVVKVAETFARNGFIILTPNIPYLSTRRLTTTAVDDFIAAYQYLETQPNVKKNKMGFIGFCTSGGLTLVAAEDDRIAKSVDFTLVVNPYFNLENLYKAITTRQVDGNKWLPHFKTVEVYNRETIALLQNSNDEMILFKNLINIGEENLAKGNFPKPSSEDNRKLSETGKFLHAALTNKDPKMSSYYLENATEAQKTFLKEISPQVEIQKLNAKAYIFAEKSFDYIPYTEARDLAGTLKGLDKNYTYQELSTLPANTQVNRFPLKTYLIEGAKFVKFLLVFFREVN